MKLGVTMALGLALASCSPQAQQLEAKVARVVYTQGGRACVLLATSESAEVAAVLCEAADDALGAVLDTWQARLQRELAASKDAGAPATGYTR